MNVDQTRINELVAHPAEGLNIEVKRLFDPDSTDGIVKIVKAAIALRNRNGGYFVLGLDDKTLQPDNASQSADVRNTFNLDKIQAIVSKYAHEPFEIAVAFGLRDGREFPVIVIPEGVRVPVAIRRDLFDGDKKLLREGDVYFRTLASNGTPSTAVARYGDWRDIVDVCFENREADIGRFLRRHLGQRDLQQFLATLSGSSFATPPAATLRTRAEALLRDGEQRFQAAVGARKFTGEELKKIDSGAWSVALIVDPPHESALPDQDFMNIIGSSNPRYTGWPAWLDSRAFSDIASRPRVVDKAWEALIVSLASRGHIDFLRFDPRGEFYQRRVLQDDLTPKVQSGKALDVVLMIIRVAEAIAVPLNLIRTLGWQPEDTKLGFGFRWTKLSGRELSSWANPLVHISGGTAHDDSIETFVEIPLDTSPSAIAPYVEQVLRDLFVLFDGYILPTSAFEHWVQKLVERRL